MAQIRVTVDSSGGRFRIPAGQPGGGRFAPGGSEEFRRQLREANRRMAREQQAEVIDNMKGSIIRRSVSSGRLLRVTSSPENIEWSDFHYGVGREDFLDKSIAKYWRQIEEGYSGHVGREITGFWGGSITRITATRVYAGRPWSRHGSRRGDMFIPAGATRNTFRENGRFASPPAAAGGRAGAPSFVKTTTIKNPIAPHNDYSNAFVSYRPGVRALAEVNRLITWASQQAWRLET